MSCVGLKTYKHKGITPTKTYLIHFQYVYIMNEA